MGWCGDGVVMVWLCQLNNVKKPGCAKISGELRKAMDCWRTGGRTEKTKFGFVSVVRARVRVEIKTSLRAEITINISLRYDLTHCVGAAVVVLSSFRPLQTLSVGRHESLNRLYPRRFSALSPLRPFLAFGLMVE